MASGRPGWGERRAASWGRPAARRLDGEAEQRLEALLASDPQAAGDAATGWTVPVLRTELAQDGWTASERTIRRTVHRLGGSWKRPQFVLGRPDPADAANKGRSSSK